MLLLAVIGILPLLAGDQESEEALKAFAKAYNSPNASARATAVGSLAQTRTIPIMSKLAELLVADEGPVRIAAAKGLGDFTENKPKAAAALMEAMGVNSKEFDVAAAILTALGTLGEESALAIIHQHFASKDAKDKDHLIPKAAILAAGLARNRESIHVLLDLAKDLEKAEGTNSNSNTKASKSSGGGVRGIPGGGGANPQKDRAKALLPVIVKAMQTITKEKWATIKEWEVWWEKRQANYVVPK
jgi:HEAT repeat protein